MKYLEQLSQKTPDFPVPLRAHTVWEGMTVKLSCTVQGCPPPEVTWYEHLSLRDPILVALINLFRLMLKETSIKFIFSDYLHIEITSFCLPVGRNE